MRELKLWDMKMRRNFAVGRKILSNGSIMALSG
jgi:hypothetical protein